MTLAPGHRFHGFHSHTWSSAQDANATIKRQLTRLLEHVHLFLDVDDLDDIARLDEYIAQSQLMMLYVSRGYFTSAACQAEMMSMVKWGKPFLLIHESDPKNGGKPWDEFVQECPEQLNATGIFGRLPPEYLQGIQDSGILEGGQADPGHWKRDGWFKASMRPDAPTVAYTLRLKEQILGRHHTPVVWHRIPDFQIVSLKGIAQALLQTS